MSARGLVDAARGVDAGALSNADLDARLRELQQRAFAVYEAAAQAAEANPGADGDAAYARAEAEVAPLIAEAKSLSDERVRRLRRRARFWRNAAVAVAVIGGAFIAWIALRG